MIAVTITLNGKPSSVSFDHQINPSRTDFPLWNSLITRNKQPLQNIALKWGFRSLLVGQYETGTAFDIVAASPGVLYVH